MQKITTKSAPAAIGPYSQAVKVNGVLFTSGQIGIVPEGGFIVAGGVRAETRQVLTNLNAVLAAADMDFSNVVKTTVFMVDIDDFERVNEVYAEFFGESLPARSAVAVKALPKGALVEIELVAIDSHK